MNKCAEKFAVVFSFSSLKEISQKSEKNAITWDDPLKLK